MRAWAKALFWASVCLVALTVFVVYVVESVKGHMMNAPPSPPIRRPKPSISPQENAWPLLERAARLVGKVPDSEKEFVWRICKAPHEEFLRKSEQVRAVLCKHEKALELLDQGLARKGLVIPVASSWFKQVQRLYPYIPAWRYLAYLKCLKGRLLLCEGRAEEGLREILDVVALGHMVQNGHGVLIHWLTGRMIEAIGLKQLRLIPREEGFPKGAKKQAVEAWLEVCRELKKFSDPRVGLRKALAVEYCQFETTLRSPSEMVEILAAESEGKISEAQARRRLPALYKRERTERFVRFWYNELSLIHI